MRVHRSRNYAHTERERKINNDIYMGDSSPTGIPSNGDIHRIQCFAGRQILR